MAHLALVVQEVQQLRRVPLGAEAEAPLNLAPPALLRTALALRLAIGHPTSPQNPHPPANPSTITSSFSV